MDYVLGIDGGGTKTSFVLSDTQGNIVTQTNKAGIDFNYVGVQGVKETIRAGVAEIQTNAACELTDIKAVCAGIPCYGEYQEWDSVCLEFFCAYFNKANVKCVNDVEVGMYGSLALEPGIHLVAGTGSIAYGIDINDMSARSGGWNEHFSDEGSCYWLGLRTCELFSKQSDNRVTRSALYDIVKAETHFSDDYQFIQYFKDNAYNDRQKTAKLQLLLEKAANAGDISAIECYKKAAFELSLCVKAIYGKLKMPPQAKVSYSGGLFKIGHFILEPLADYLSDLDICLQEPELSPAEGALLYALVNMMKNDKKIIMKNIKKSAYNNLWSRK